MILFGVRSPLVVDCEIAAQRCGTPFRFGVSLDDEHPRTMFDIEIVDYPELDKIERFPALPCAFSPRRREELARIAEEAGFELAETLVDPTAILPPRLRLGRAGFINAGVVIGGGSMFGDGVLVNRSASIGHHCLLEDWVSVGPGAILSGNVRVGRNSMIGAGAILQSDIRVGENVRIAAGSLVRKNVPDNSLVSGNPAKTVRARPFPSSLERAGGE